MSNISKDTGIIFDHLLPQNQEFLLTLARVAAVAEQGARQQMEQQRPPEQPPASA